MRPTITQLKELVEQDQPKIAFRALATLGAMDLMDILRSRDEVFLRSQLSQSNEHLRAWAIGLIADHWPLDDVMGPTSVSDKHKKRVEHDYLRWQETFLKIASTDPSGLVRLKLASTLQRLPTQFRLPLASALMSRVEDADDHNLPLLVWYGLIPVAEDDPVGLAQAAAASRWPKTQRLMARRLVQNIETSPEAVNTLVGSISLASADAQENLLLGMSDGLKGWSRAQQPKQWPKLVAAIEDNASSKTKDTVRELSVIFGDGRALEDVRKIVLDKNAAIGLRRTALEALVASKSDGVIEICLPLLNDARINTIALRGVAASADNKVAQALIKNYRRFRSPKKPLVIEALASRKNFADALLSAIEAGKIPLADLTAYDVRQIRSLDDSELNKRVVELWGEIRESSEEKKDRIDELKTLLTAKRLAKASPSDGRVLYNQSCAKCHRLFGYGEKIGPELTGANRNNIDYLLENIVDPSAVVSKDYRVTIVQTTDGQTLNGLVAAQNDKTLSLQTQNELKTILLEDIEETKRSAMSPMPDGMLDNLSEDQITNLISYLMQPAQVQLPENQPEPLTP